jgi:ArsR family transcriptional regulator
MDSTAAILALAALAQPTRLDVFRLLVKREPEGLAAGDIARELAVPHNTMSSHLSILERAALISSERRGRSIMYRANLDALQSMTLFLLQDCCGGQPALCASLIESIKPCCSPKEDKTREKAHVRSHVRSRV